MRREQKVGLIAILVIVPGAIGLIAAAKQTFGGARGESCEDLSGCKFGNVCIAHKCYAKCASTPDCPADMHCGKTNVTVVTQGTFSQDEQSGTENICFPNAAPSARSSRATR